MNRNRRRKSQRGEVLIEFSLVALEVCLILLLVFEVGRAVLVSATVAHAARTGVRYAIVHGATRTGSGVTGPSGPGNITNIQDNVKKYAGSGLMDTSRLTINVSYPDVTTNSPGSRVVVTVVYPYDPFGLFPLHMRLGSTAEGIIAF